MNSAASGFFKERIEVANEEFLESVFEEMNLAVGLDEIFHGRAEGLIVLPGHSAKGGNRQINQRELLGRVQRAAAFDHVQNLGAQGGIEVLGGLIVVGDQQRKNQCAPALNLARRLQRSFRQAREHRRGGVHAGVSRQGWGTGFGELEVWRDLGDAFLDRRVGREEVEPRFRKAVSKEHVAGLPGAWMPKARSEVSDFGERAGDATRVAGELHGGSVGEEFALTAYGSLNEL